MKRKRFLAACLALLLPVVPLSAGASEEPNQNAVIRLDEEGYL